MVMREQYGQSSAISLVLRELDRTSCAEEHKGQKLKGENR